jgi:hypothetical protein
MTVLPELMQCLADKIIADDWFESQSPDAAQSFYVIGAEAHWDDVKTRSYITCFVGPESKVEPLAEHEIGSQVAGSRPEEYLKRERRRLEQVGVSVAAIDRFIDAHTDALAGFFPESMPFAERLDLLLPFVEAVRVSVGRTKLHEEARGVGAAREKICLREVVRKYATIVDKWEQLDPLPFFDPQFEEASKAYLYGFYRSSVVLSASTLEKHLKRAARVDEFREYSDLVEDAAIHLGMGEAWVEQAKRVFRVRNLVVHDNHAPTHNEAGEVFRNARIVLVRILSV